MEIACTSCKAMSRSANVCTACGAPMATADHASAAAMPLPDDALLSGAGGFSAEEIQGMARRDAAQAAHRKNQQRLLILIAVLIAVVAGVLIAKEKRFVAWDSVIGASSDSPEILEVLASRRTPVQRVAAMGGLLSKLVDEADTAMASGGDGQPVAADFRSRWMALNEVRTNLRKPLKPADQPAMALYDNACSETGAYLSSFADADPNAAQRAQHLSRAKENLVKLGQAGAALEKTGGVSSAIALAPAPPPPPPKPAEPVADAPVAEALAAGTIRMGVGMAHGGEMDMQTAELVGGYFGKVLGHPVEARLFGYDDLAQAVGDHTIEVAYMTPLAFVKAARHAKLTPLRQALHHGNPSYRSVVFVRKDSEIQKPSDLKGKTIAWIQSGSASGNLLPRGWLRVHKFDLNSTFKDQVYLADHAKVCNAVFRKRVDAAASYADETTDGSAPTVVDGCQPSLGKSIDDLRIVFATDPIPNDVIVVRADAPKKLVDDLSAAIDGMGKTPEGQAVLRDGFHAEGFTKPNMAGFATIEGMLETSEAGK